MPLNLLPVFTNGYTIARHIGFLDTQIGGSLFISAYFGYKRWLEDPFAGLVRLYPSLFHGGDIVDVGANIGYCSVLFSRAIDSNRNIFAFEPEPFNLKLLRRVIETRANDRVVVVPAAVGDHEGEIALHLNPKHHGDHRVAAPGEKQLADHAITVPIMSVDGYLKRRGIQAPVCLIKVDVQGYELSVCQGSYQTLDRNPACSVVLEYMPAAIEQFGYRPADLLAWFYDRGYHCYLINKHGQLKPGEPRDLGSRGYIDLLFSRARLE
jgi:FkbM family methyltransferase